MVEAIWFTLFVFLYRRGFEGTSRILSQVRYQHVSAPTETLEKMIDKVTFPKLLDKFVILDTVLITFPVWLYFGGFTGPLVNWLTFLSLAVFFSPFSFPSELSPDKHDTVNPIAYVAKWAASKIEIWIKGVLLFGVVYVALKIGFVESAFEWFKSNFLPPMKFVGYVDLSNAIIVTCVLFMAINFLVLFAFGIKNYLLTTVGLVFAFNSYMLYLNKYFWPNHAIEPIIINSIVAGLVVNFLIDYALHSGRKLLSEIP
ncbi:MAG: hypothetical protein AB2689_26890 [Candidatus Thiodiazotropha taylori]